MIENDRISAWELISFFLMIFLMTFILGAISEKLVLKTEMIYNYIDGMEGKHDK